MYQNILLTIDPSEESSWKKALPTAVELCKSSGAKLYILAVVPDFGTGAVSAYFPDGYQDEVIAKTKTELEALAAKAVPSDVSANAIVICGTIYEEILNSVKAIRPDLVVMASHRPELKDYLLGPNAARVVRHASCSVLVVRD